MSVLVKFYPIAVLNNLTLVSLCGTYSSSDKEVHIPFVLNAVCLTLLLCFIVFALKELLCFISCAFNCLSVSLQLHLFVVVFHCVAICCVFVQLHIHTI